MQLITTARVPNIPTPPYTPHHASPLTINDLLPPDPAHTQITNITVPHSIKPHILLYMQYHTPSLNLQPYILIQGFFELYSRGLVLSEGIYHHTATQTHIYVAKEVVDYYYTTKTLPTPAAIPLSPNGTPIRTYVPHTAYNTQQLYIKPSLLIPYEPLTHCLYTNRINANQYQLALEYSYGEMQANRPDLPAITLQDQVRQLLNNARIHQ